MPAQARLEEEKRSHIDPDPAYNACLIPQFIRI